MASFYRTAAGAEVDLIIDFPSGDRWAIEIKRSLAARVSRGFRISLSDLNPTKSFSGSRRHRVLPAVGIR